VPSGNSEHWHEAKWVSATLAGPAGCLTMVDRHVGSGIVDEVGTVGTAQLEQGCSTPGTGTKSQQRVTGVEGAVAMRWLRAGSARLFQRL